MVLQPNGEWKSQGWAVFKGTSKNGQLIDGSLFANEQDRDAKDSEERALAQYIFNTKDEKTRLEKIRFRKLHPETVSAVTSNHVVVLMSDKERDIPADYRDVVPKNVSLVGAAEAWAQTCRNLAFAAKFNPKEAEAAADTMRKQGIEEKIKEKKEAAETAK